MTAGHDFRNVSYGNEYLSEKVTLIVDEFPTDLFSYRK